jgi:hypothetical protein
MKFILLAAALLLATSLSTEGQMVDSGSLPVNVMAFGAKCDNATTDDTQAFQNAAAAVARRPTGGALYIPGGRCKVSSTLTFALSGNTSLELAGEGRDVSEIVFTNATGDGIDISESGQSWWMRTVANPAAVLRIHDVSLVYAGPGINGIALNISNAGTAVNALSPRVKISNLGIHGTVNGFQGWHDGISYVGMPSGLTVDDAYMVFANVSFPYSSVGSGVHIAGGPVVSGSSRPLSALYYFTNITIQNAHHGIDIGEGVQGIYMDRVGGNADWFTYATQPSDNGDTGSIAITNSNQAGYYGSVYINNVEYVWLNKNQLQPFGSGNYNAIELHNGGVFNIDDNTVIGILGPHTGKWQALFMDKIPADALGGYAQQLIHNNHISLLDYGIELTSNVKNTVIEGNDFNNVTHPYIIQNDDYAENNIINGVIETHNSLNHDALIQHGLTVNGPVSITADLARTTPSFGERGGLFVGWNFETGAGEADLFIGPGPLKGGMNIYSLTSAGAVQQAAVSPLYRFDPGGNLSMQGSTLSGGVVKSRVYTVATLPACNSATEGSRAGISDAVANGYHAVLAGGGLFHVPVYCNGTSWIGD